MSLDRKFSFLVHGEPGVGKSRLADTVPGPRLLLDAEGGAAEWTPSSKIEWDPHTQPLPSAHADGSPITTDTTVFVVVRDWTTVELCYRTLNSGQHYFESAIWDSITEIQDKCKKAVMAGGDMSEKKWGVLLDRMADSVKEWRDLRVHPAKRVNTIFVALSHNRDGNRWKADLQGAIARKLPGYVDLVGYMVTTVAPGGQAMQRSMYIQPVGPFDAKDRTDILTQAWGTTIPDPNMATIAAVLNGAAAA